MQLNRSIPIGLAALTMSLWTTSAFASYQGVVTDLSPQAYWRFEEADSASYALPTVAAGTQNPPPSSGDWFRYLNKSYGSTTKQGGEGVVGRGVTLDYTQANTPWYMDENQGVATPAFATFKPQDFSVEFWVKPQTGVASGTPTTPSFVVKATGTRAFGISDGPGDGGLYMGIDNLGGTTGGRVYAGNPGFLNDKWTFVTVTFDQAAGNPVKGTMLLYLNGVLTAGAADNIDMTGFAADRDNWGGLNLTGHIFGDPITLDELAVFDYALTPAQINEQFLAAIPEPAALVLLTLGGLLVRWRMRRSV